jgi:hypothetical protein
MGGQCSSEDKESPGEGGRKLQKIIIIKIFF